MVELTSLSPGPPRSSPLTPRRRPPPTVHVHTSSRRRGRILGAATATPGADDYHSTIRSLNSRGRHVPRKSLGQVIPLTPESAPPTGGLTFHHVPTRLSSPRRTTRSTPRWTRSWWRRRGWRRVTSCSRSAQAPARSLPRCSRPALPSLPSRRSVTLLCSVFRSWTAETESEPLGGKIERSSWDEIEIVCKMVTIICVTVCDCLKSQLLMPQNVALFGWVCGYILRVWVFFPFY